MEEHLEGQPDQVFFLKPDFHSTLQKRSAITGTALDVPGYYLIPYAMYNRNDHDRRNRDNAYDRNQHSGRHAHENNDRSRRYEQSSRYDDDYGPFSNIYDDHSERRGDFDTRYNEQDNYYYRNTNHNDRSDEARGQSLGDMFRGGRSRGAEDREYFTAYRSGREGSDPQYSLYGSDEQSRYSNNQYREKQGSYGDDFHRHNGYNHARDHHFDRGENRYHDGRDASGRSYSGYTTGYEQRRRYNEGFLY